jgi:hypothetical protein
VKHRESSTKGWRLAVFSVAIGSPICLPGCGGSEPPPEAPTEQAVQHRATRPKSSMSVSGQLGSLDDRAVDRKFGALLPRFQSCIGEGMGRVEFLGGHLRFLVRIREDGSIKWAYVAESTVGDRDTEKCMLAAIRGAIWPPPIDGEGQAEKSFDFEPSPDVRDAVPWSADRVASALSSGRSKLAQCTHGARGRYRATAYVQTNGSVIAAGVAPPDERGEQNADCIANALKEMKFPSPGSWPAKVSFEVD